MAKIRAPKSILISRTDSIGDVMLTLPLAAALKKKYPDAVIGFLGRHYTRPVIEACQSVDEFVLLDDFMAGKSPENADGWGAIVHVFPVAAIAAHAKAIRIPLRIGTTNRSYHWLTCNSLVRLSRKNSNLHEAQLNFALLKPLGIEGTPTLTALGAMYGLSRLKPLPAQRKEMLAPGKYHLILHPKSQGSAREWGLDNFEKLISILNADRYQIFISGTDAERSMLQPLLDKCTGRVVDIVGAMDLGTFMAFINECDGLVSASTGPLHIAAALNKKAVGIYPPIRPMHPGRWAPLGPQATALALDKECNDCRKNAAGCHCMKEVYPTLVQIHLQ